MAFEDWEKDSEGKVKLYPLVAYETCVPHGVLCGLKAHYFESPNDLLGGQGSTFPFVFTPAMARRLAAALTKCADEAELGPDVEVAH